MHRVTVLLRRADEPRYSKLVDAGDLQDLLNALEIYGPMPVGFAIEVDPRFRDNLPEGWDVECLDGGDGGCVITGPS